MAERRSEARGWADSWRGVIALILAVAAARIAYLAFLCPYALIEDEAHYWEWSRRLDWSYYSKGPGIAWAIAASTRLFGDSEFAVRLPAALASALCALAIAGLTRDILGRPRTAFYAVACFFLAPLYQFTSLFATIDGPYLASWAFAAWGAWRGLTGRRWGWAMLGAALGVGILFKYTILLLLPGLAVFAWIARAALPRPRLAPIVSALLLACAGLAPIVFWNAAHGWPTLGHLLGHLGLASGDVPVRDLPASSWHYQPAWTLEFLGVQAVILGPVLYLALRGIAFPGDAWASPKQHAPGPSADPAPSSSRSVLFLLCCAAPILLFYLVITLFTRVEGNWPAAGYLTLLPAAGLAASAARRRAPADPPVVPGAPVSRSSVTLLWRLSLFIGLATALISLRLDWVAASPPIAALGRALQRAGVKDDRPLIPSGRFMAARDIAADAARLADALRERTGLEPFYIAEHYGRASLLAFYLPGRPTVYCSSSHMGEGRPTQYDFWPDTDLRDPRLLGRPAVCLGKTRDRWLLAFEHVEDAGRLPHEPKKDRLAFLGFGYAGFGFRGAPPD